MNIKATASSLALVLALSMTGGALAQNMFQGHDLSNEDMAKVQQQCDKLNTIDTTESTTEDKPSADRKAEEPSGINESTVPFDMETITLDQCREAGLVPAQ